MTVLNYARVDQVLQNLVALEKQINADVLSILQVDTPAISFPTGNAFSYARRENVIYPQWTNGIADAKPEQFGIWEDYEPFVISIEFQRGLITEGADGSLETQLYGVWIPYTLATFRATPRLQTVAQPQRPGGLLESSLRIGKALMPGEVIATQYLLTCHFAITNPERDY